MTSPPEHSGIVVRAATRHDIPAVADVLTDAFVDQPMFRWLQPDDRYRRPMARALFDWAARHGHPVTDATHVATVGTELVGAAVWARPGAWKPVWWRELLMIPAFLRADRGRGLRDFGIRGSHLERAMRAAHPDSPHWYLVGLGVRPTFHGTGVGSELVRAGLGRADVSGTPAYLECEERLIRYYRGLGFTLMGDIAVPPGAPSHNGMWHAG